MTFAGEDIPFLQDATHMDLGRYQQQPQQEDPLGVSQFHTFASLILYGDQIKPVRQQCEALSDALMLQHTRVRERPFQGDTDAVVDLDSLGLAGRICMGSSRVDLGHHGEAHVVRLAATTNEDLYRIFHHCLYPLHSQFGMEFYKERIRAKASEILRADHKVSGSTTAVEKQATIFSVHKPALVLDIESIPEALETPSTTASEGSGTVWSAYMLADSALPTGSFAHSASLEVASQMGMITNVAQLETFVQAATRSTLQVMAPFLVAGHELASRMDDRHQIRVEDSYLEEWKRLNRQAQAVLASNAPACAASLDQGKSLARVAQQWLESEDETNQLLLKCFDHGCHMGPVLGALGSRLGLTTDQVGRLYGYCVARDMVSAAVRLSLVGPLASVKSLRKIQKASDDGWMTFLKRQRQIQAQVNEKATTGTSTGSNMDPMMMSAACAPVIEAVHPCHELLQVRLFRT